jgi:hypothetical protein
MNYLFSQKGCIFIVILTGLFSSCNTVVYSPIDRTADMIEGTYDLAGIMWEGDALDVNGDGITSNDLYSELMSLPINAENTHRAYVRCFSYDRTDGFVKMQLPMQNVNVTDDGRYPAVWMIGSRMTVNLLYQIDSQGHLTVDHFESLMVNDDDARVEMVRMNNGTVWFDEEENLCFKVTYTLFDYCKEQLVEGIIHYTFEKTVS